MKEQLVHALKTKYDADYQMHKANLDIYLNNPVGIGEHPQIMEELRGQIQLLTDARDNIDTIITLENKRNTHKNLLND